MLGLPDFGASSPLVSNPLIYPRRILIQVLESVFSQQSLIIYPNAPTNPFLFIKSSNEATKASKIVIADSFSDELIKTDPRPTIILGRGTLQFSDMAVDAKKSFSTNKLLTNAEPAIGMTGRTRMNYSDIVTMNLALQCYARRDTEVEQLAWITAGAIRFFEQQIKDGARLHKITSPSIGSTTPYKSDQSKTDIYTITISLMVYQTLNWNVHTQATLSELSPNAGFSNLSGSLYPRRTGTFNPSVYPRIIADSPDLLLRWLSP